MGGLLAADEHRVEKARVDAELTATQPAAAQVNLERAATLLTNLPALWPKADAEHQRKLAVTVLESLYVDSDYLDKLTVYLRYGIRELIG